MAKEGPRELRSNPMRHIRRQALLSQVRKQNQTRTVAYVTLYTFQPQLDARQTGESNCTGKRFTNHSLPRDHVLTRLESTFSGAAKCRTLKQETGKAKSCPLSTRMQAACAV